MLFKALHFPTAILMVTLVFINGCARQESAPDVLPQKGVAVDNTFKPVTSIQELMLFVIDPNIDPIWNSVSTVSSYEGVVETKPQTEEEWQKLRGHAITLREVYNLLAVPGRKVAELNAITSSGGGELHAEQIQALIDSQWGEFLRHAAQLQAASDLLLNAIDARNVDALEEAGGVVEHACEGCHSKFWYPGDRRPGQ